MQTCLPALKFGLHLYKTRRSYKAFFIHENNKVSNSVRIKPSSVSKATIKTGRPSNMNSSWAEAIRLLHASGMGKRKIATKLSVGVQSVYESLK